MHSTDATAHAARGRRAALRARGSPSDTRARVASPLDEHSGSTHGARRRAPSGETDRGVRYEMAKRFGRIAEERSASGSVRWRIDCGVLEGARVRIAGRPNPINPTRVVPFASREAAEVELEYLRAAILSGANAPEVVSTYRGRQRGSSDCVEPRVAQYLVRWRMLVSQGKRSPTSLAELERYAAPGGYWSWWSDHSISRLCNHDVKAWHLWLGEQRKRGRRGQGERISAKTQKNISDAFRAFLRAESDDTEGELRVPRFQPIAQDEYAARTLSPNRLLAVLAAIPWERRGAYLAMAFEQLRVSEVVAHDLTDWDSSTGELHLHRGRKGHRLDAPIRENKNRSARRRRPWWPELVDWLEWRTAQASAADRHACALFWNPTASNAAKRWGEGLLRRHWYRACASVGESIALQEGTRHTVISRLAEVLSQAALQAQTRHASAASLAHYTVGARPDPVAMVDAMDRRGDHGATQGRPEPSGDRRRARKAGEIAGMPDTYEAIR